MAFVLGRDSFHSSVWIRVVCQIKIILWTNQFICCCAPMLLLLFGDSFHSAQPLPNHKTKRNQDWLIAFLPSHSIVTYTQFQLLLILSILSVHSLSLFLFCACSSLAQNKSNHECGPNIEIGVSLMFCIRASSGADCRTSDTLKAMPARIPQLIDSFS